MKKLNPKLQAVSKKKKKKKGGCLRCFGIAFLTVILVFVSALTALFFVADSLLKNNFGLSMADCFTLIGGIYEVDESKIITETAPTDDDIDAFYEELSNTTFIKASAIDDVVGTALSEALVPSIASALGVNVKTTEQNTTLPVLKQGAQNNSFDWESYLIELVEDGVIEIEKVKTFCSSEESVEDLYENQFVMNVTGKSMIAFVDSILNTTLDSIEGMSGFKGKLGVRQLKFTTASDGIKTINLVVQIKPKDLVELVVQTQGDKLAGLEQYKWAIDIGMSLVPQNILFGMDLNLQENSASVEPFLNNITTSELDKWFNVVSRLGGTDVKETLNQAITQALADLKSETNGMVDLFAMVGDGSIKLDVYNVASELLSDSLELEGEDRLSKYETAETIANVLYANMDVNGNGREEILTSQAPKFLSENWKDTARVNFKQWLKDSIAFDDNKTVDEFIKEFEDEEGKFGAPSSMSAIFNYLDTEYMKQGLAFLKNPLALDDTYIAYLFDDYKSAFLSGGGMTEYLDKINLEYVRIDEEGSGLNKRVYLMLGISILTDDMLALAGFEEAGFITSIIGEEIFICAKADITKGISDRNSTRFMLNGLSESKTQRILSTVSKIAKQDIISEFIDTYIEDFLTELEVFENDFFEIEFTESNGDGTILLPSASNMIEKILSKNEGKEIDGDALIDALSALLTSDHEYLWYSSSIRDSSMILTGNEFAYDDYYSLVKAQFYAHYMMKTGSDALSIVEFVEKISEILSSDDALSVIMGEDENDRLLSFTKDYFSGKTSVTQTRPIIDGHTLAYLLNESDGKFFEVLDSSEIDLFDTVEIRDIEIVNDYLTIYMQANVNSILDLQAGGLGEYESFLKRLLGGEGETMSISLKIYVGKSLPIGAKEVEVRLGNLSDDKMDTLIDALEVFGVTMFNFENEDGSVNENNEIVQMGRELAKFFNQDCSVEGDKLVFPSVFTIMSEDVINKENITDEKLFFAIADFVLSENVNVSYDSGESFAESYVALTGSTFNASDYDNSDTEFAQYGSLVNEAVELKYMLREGKTVGDMISVVSMKGQSQTDAFLGSNNQDGLIDTGRDSMANYFTGIGASYEETIPVLDGHTLAYVVDKYKDNVKDMANFSSTSSDMFDLVTILDIQTVTENGEDYVILSVRADITKLMSEMNDGEADIHSIFELFESSSKTVTVQIKKALNTVSPVEVKLNDMINGVEDRGLSNLSDLLKAYGINYFDTTDEDCVFNSIAISLRNMINSYMPYDSESKRLVLDSAFDYIGQAVETKPTGHLMGIEAYSLVKAFTLYGAVSESKVSATEEFDKKTSAFYYLNNGTSTVNGIINGTNNENNLTFRNNEYSVEEDKYLTTREIIIAENATSEEKKYDTAFTIDQQYLAGLVDSLGISSMDSKYSLDQISVLNRDNYIKAYAIISLDEFFNTDDLGSLKDFNVLPEKLKVSLPIAFDGGAEADWKIEDMDDFSEIKRILKLLGVDLDDEIENSKTDMKESVGKTLEDYEMKFESESGLKMPSLVSLIKKMRNDTVKQGDYDENDLLSDDDVKYLFDNFVCYQVHDYHLGAFDELLAHDDFMEVMNENYKIGTKVMIEQGSADEKRLKPYLFYASADLERDDEPCVYIVNTAVARIKEAGQELIGANVELDDCISYWDLMFALDLIGVERLKNELVSDGIINSVDDEYLPLNIGDMINWDAITNEIAYLFGLSFNKPEKVHTDDFILNERVSSTLFFDAAQWSEDKDGDGIADEGFDFEFMRAPVNGWVIVRGAINISNKFADMGGSFVSLMPNVITIEIIQDLKGEGILSDPHDPEWGEIITKDSNGDGEGDGFGFEIYDLPISNKQGLTEGDYAHRQANTERLVDVFEKFGAKMGDIFKENSEEEETFSERIKDSVNKLFENLDGKESINAPDEERKVASTVKNLEGKEDEIVDDGILIPSLIHYLYANWRDISMPADVREFFRFAADFL